MALEITIKDAPKQDLQRFGEYVYRVRIELRPDITLEQAYRRRSVISPRDIRFLEFDLPAHIVCPGCDENWQKAQAVMRLKREPVDSAIWLIRAAINFGVLSKDEVKAWEPAKRLPWSDAIDV
jgi:hypothetical protein